MVSNIISIIVALLVFTVLIVVHEFGHFLAARKCGVPVEEFSIGMGPCLYQRKGKKTDFSIRLFPIGGYCKMTGEEDKSDNPDAFCNKNVWQRILIVIAGASFNIIFAIICLIVLSNVTESPTHEVVSVEENSAADIAGIQVGDEIIGVNGKEYSLMENIMFDLAVEKNINNEIELIVYRDGEVNNVKLNYVPSVEITDVKDYESDILKVGTIIDTINGKKINEISNLKAEFKNSKVVSESEDDEEKEEISYDIKVTIAGDETEYTLTEDEVEILKDNIANRTNIIGVGIKYEKVGFLKSFKHGFDKTIYYITSTYKSFALMFGGKVSKDQVAGPVGIVKMFGDTYQTGLKESVGRALINLFSLAAMISINLGVINLLPLPALDGGRFFILLIEVVRRKQMDLDKESMIHFVGFILLMILMVLIIFNDVTNIIG